MSKKEATTSAQFDILLTEMEKHPDIACGSAGFGSSKAKAEKLWEDIADMLNAVGPPTRTPTKWRKVWTDYRGRLRKRLSINNTITQQGGDESSKYYELTPLEKIIANILTSGAAANPSDSLYECKVSNTISEPSRSASSSPLAEVMIYPHDEHPQDWHAASSSLNIGSEWKDDEVMYNVPVKTEISLTNQKLNFRKRHRDKKEEERKKLIKLTEKQTEEMSRMTAALEKLTAAIEAQTKIIQKKIK